MRWTRAVSLAALACATLALPSPSTALADDLADEEGAKKADGAVAFEPGPISFADALAKAKAVRKPLFMDFWSDG